MQRPLLPRRRHRRHSNKQGKSHDYDSKSNKIKHSVFKEALFGVQTRLLFINKACFECKQALFLGPHNLLKIKEKENPPTASIPALTVYRRNINKIIDNGIDSQSAGL